MDHLKKCQPSQPAMATVEISTVDSSGVRARTPEEMPTVTTGKDGKKRKRSDSTVPNGTVDDTGLTPGR